jgi:cytochrome P450
MFPDPDSFELVRETNRHLTFGQGVHKCIGAPLARMELTLVLDELLHRTTSFTLDGEPHYGCIAAAPQPLRLPMVFVA